MRSFNFLPATLNHRPGNVVSIFSKDPGSATQLLLEPIDQPKNEATSHTGDVYDALQKDFECSVSFLD